jgi:hypothetical protein
MSISVEVFAEMLGIKPGELVWAVKAGNELNGIPLPKVSRKGNNSGLMFPLEEVVKFVEVYKGI